MVVKGGSVSEDTIIFDRSMTIEENVPIKLDGSLDCLIIKGSCPGVTVTLVPTEHMQPCIGPETETGKSFGRFSLSPYRLKKLVIDNIHIVCLAHADNPNFAIGTYGHREVPVIECVNGGVIDCPEMYGERVMVDNIIRNEGSTKYQGSADYIIRTPDVSEDSLLSNDQRELINEIRERNPELADKLNFEYPKLALKSLKDLAPFMTPTDTTPWKTSQNATGYMTLKSCAILGMPLDLQDDTEYIFELNKSDWHEGRFFEPFGKNDDVDYGKLMGLVILYHLITMRDNPNPKMRWEVAYETIPTYFHDFARGVSSKTNVLLYLKNTFKDIAPDAVPELARLNDDVAQALMPLMGRCEEVAKDVLQIDDGVEYEVIK